MSERKEIIPASLATVEALQLDIKEMLRGEGGLNFTNPQRNRIVKLDTSSNPMRDPNEYYPREAIIETTLDGDVHFTNGDLRRTSRPDTTYVVFEKGDGSIRAVAETNGPVVNRLLTEEEVQALRKYVQSLQTL